jgi:transcriptional regulator with XRE-family HTH domain
MTPMTRVLSSADVRAFRTKHKLSQQELGELLGLTRNTVGRWEAGIRPIPEHMNLTLEGLALHLPHRRRGARPIEAATTVPRESSPG